MKDDPVTSFPMVIGTSGPRESGQSGRRRATNEVEVGKWRDSDGVAHSFPLPILPPPTLRPPFRNGQAERLLKASVCDTKARHMIPTFTLTLSTPCLSTYPYPPPAPLLLALSSSAGAPHTSLRASSE
jgi:hypothetical protein